MNTPDIDGATGGTIDSASDTAIDTAIARHATAEFDDTTPVLEAGLESLSLIRLAVELATDENAEIDATRLADVTTVGDLKAWLREIASAATVGAHTS